MSDSDNDSVGSRSAMPKDNDLLKKLNDPIIQKILQGRSVELEDNITQEDELVRQQRMYIFLRNSKKYRKLQVEDANQKELTSDLLDIKVIEEACDSIKDINLTKNANTVKKRKVSFCECNSIIPTSRFESDEFQT